MGPYLTIVTRKGQITIPAEYRRALGLAEGDKVAVTLEDGQVRVSPYGSVAARTAGVVKWEGPVLSAEELRAAAEAAIAEAAIKRMGN